MFYTFGPRLFAELDPGHLVGFIKAVYEVEAKAGGGRNDDAENGITAEVLDDAAQQEIVARIKTSLQPDGEIFDSEEEGEDE